MRISKVRRSGYGVEIMTGFISHSSRQPRRSIIHYSNLLIIKFLSILLICTLMLSCSDSDNQNTLRESGKAQLVSGTYKVAYGFNYAPVDEQKILAITANLDRTVQQLVFSMQDGTKRTLSLTSRNESQWRGDCATMSTYVLDEVADLAPVPLQLESMIFNTPLVYTKCSPNRMILSSTLSESDSSSPILVFDLANPLSFYMADFIQKHNFHIESGPTTVTATLPQQFTDANWSLKEGLCQQAGYDLTPYAGQNVSLIHINITEKYYNPAIPGTIGEPLYIWIVAKDQTSVCGFLSVRESSGLIPGVFAVNDTNIR